MPNVSLGKGLSKTKSLLTPSSPNVLWTPAQIATGAWFDASDASTITVATGVSQWDDKSGNGRHLTQPSAGAQPTYSTPGFNSLNTVDTIVNVSWMSSVDLGFASPSSMAIFCLFDGGSLVGLRRLFNVTMAGNTENLGLMLTLNNGELGQIVDNNFVGINIQNYVANEKLLYYSHHNMATDELATMKNASNLLTSPYVNTTKKQGSIVLGYSGSLARGHTGAYYEMLIFFDIPSQSDREKIEGYLMHKWGLTSNLPGGHPYKNSPPYV